MSADIITPDFRARSDRRPGTMLEEIMDADPSLMALAVFDLLRRHNLPVDGSGEVILNVDPSENYGESVSDPEASSATLQAENIIPFPT